VRITTTGPTTYSRPRAARERTVVLVASFGAFLAFLDATIVNVAFPSIQHSFPTTSLAGLSWVLTAYNIVFAAFLVVCGRLADLVGRRRTFLVGIVVFTLASGLCAAARTVDVLIAARALQALGAAALVPASLALVVQAVPAGRRTHAVGLWGAAAALAAGLGPPLGGIVVQAGGWRWAFLVNLPLGAAAAWAGRTQLVESRAPGRRARPDLRGALLLAGALGALTLGIVQGGTWGWTSLAVGCCFAVAVGLTAAFVLSSRTHPQPILDPALLRIRAFAVGNCATTLAGMGFYAYLLTNILWLQYVWRYSVLRAGLALVPGALVAALLAAVLGPLAQSRGYRRVVVPGALVWSAAYVWYATRVGTSPAFVSQWLPGQLLSGIGVGATLPLLGSAALAAVPGGRFATASAVNASARQLGGVLGVSLLVVIIGEPLAETPAQAVTHLRHGWLLSAGCFAAVAVVAAMLGRVRSASHQKEQSDPRPAPVVRGAGPAATAVPPSGPLAAAPLLSHLPSAARGRLEAAGEPVHLEAGDWLFHEGDDADGLYTVRAGRVDVVVGGRTVRTLGAGAVLGELALLTGGTRSAGVRARRDSVVLRVSATAFERGMLADPAALAVLARTLAGQLAQAAPAPDRGTGPPSLVAVVAATPGAPALPVAEALRLEIARTHRVAVLPHEVDATALQRLEADHDRVLAVAEAHDSPWWRTCVRQADLLVVVADASGPALPGPPLGREGAELVLVGAASPQAGRAWTDAVRSWRTTRAPTAAAAELAALAARISTRSVGLALAGGGARAFAHIGVLQALQDAGVHVDRVAGASQGSIIAALHATGMDAEAIRATCFEEFVRRRPFSDYTVPTVSLARGRRAEQALRRHLGDARIEDLPHQFRCASTDLLSRQPHSHGSGDVVTAVMASIALPVLFPPRAVDGHLLADGGILNNLPTNLLQERDEGPIVAVNIALGGDSRSGAGPAQARVPGIGETLLRTLFIGSAGAVERAESSGALVVTPAVSGVGLLEFHQLDAMVAAGQEAGRALLAAAGPQLGL